MGIEIFFLLDMVINISILLSAGTPLGHTILKQRYLVAAGWNVVSVCHQEVSIREICLSKLSGVENLFCCFFAKAASTFDIC